MSKINVDLTSEIVHLPYPQSVHIYGIVLRFSIDIFVYRSNKVPFTPGNH